MLYQQLKYETSLLPPESPTSHLGALSLCLKPIPLSGLHHFPAVLILCVNSWSKGHFDVSEAIKVDQQSFSDSGSFLSSMWSAFSRLSSMGPTLGLRGTISILTFMEADVFLCTEHPLHPGSALVLDASNLAEPLHSQGPEHRFYFTLS